MRARSRLCLGHVPAVGVAAEQRQVAGHAARGVLGHQDEGRPGAEHHQQDAFANHHVSNESPNSIDDNRS